MPTTVTETIGATGRDYSTWQAWETATDNDLVSADEVRVGEMYDDADFTAGITYAGATTDSTRFRVLRSATGEEYDPVTDTGVWNVVSGTIISMAAGPPTESYAVLQGFGCEQTDTNSASTVNSIFNRPNCFIQRIFLSIVTGTGTGPMYGFRVIGPALVKNCIVVGPGSASHDSASAHFLNETGDDQLAYNCVSYDAAVDGFKWGASTGSECKNCIATDSGDQDFASDGATGDHNISEDATAIGTGSLTGEVAADLFEDAGSWDFHLKAGSAAIDAGTDLSGTFTDDFDGDVRSGTWDMGAYNAESSSTRRLFIMS